MTDDVRQASRSTDLPGRVRRWWARRDERMERRRLQALPRHTPGTTRLFGRELRFVDAKGYLNSLRDIIDAGAYAFPYAGPSPRIVDCGANIGLSVIFFKRQHPAARVIAFEPDPDIFRVLEANVAAFGFRDVELHAEAVWTANGAITFQPEGGLSGRIGAPSSGGITVPTRRLRDLLSEPVDLLKIDIEGAETDVLSDCAGALGQVARVFVEYHSEAGRPQRLADLLEVLGSAGFRYHVKDAYTVAQPFVARPTLGDMDLQLNIHAWRPESAVS